MPKTKQQKQEIVKQLTDKFSKSKSVVFVDYNGLKVKEVDALRSECRAQKGEYLVAKKTLIKLAIDQNKIEGIDPTKIEGNLGVVLNYEDEVAAAKISKDFSKKHEALKMLSGIMEGKYINEEIVKTLAAIPSKPELYAKLVGSLNAPVSGFINVLQGGLRKLVYVLNSIKESKA